MSFFIFDYDGTSRFYPSILIEGSYSNPSSYDASNGYIDLTVTGDAEPFTYLWNTGSTSEDLSNLGPGTYSVTVTDASNNTDSNVITLTAPLFASYTKSNLSAYNSNDGWINVTAFGGTTPYTYLWDNSNTTSSLSNLAAGLYNITITDSNTSNYGLSITLTEPMGISYTRSNVTVYGESNGSIDVTVDGGNPPYSYLWNTGATTQDLSNLSAGTYSLTVTDSENSNAEVDAYVGQPNTSIVISSNITNVTSYGGSNGAINITISGESGPFLYEWSTGQTTEDITNLSAGSYVITVTASNDFSLTTSSTIDVMQPIGATYSNTNISQYGGSNGSIDVTIGGGYPPYTYLWDNAATTQDLSNLSPGAYTLTVTDSSNNTVEISTYIQEPLYVNYTKSNVTSYGLSNGIIDVSVYGGALPYTYLWNTGASTQDLSNLSASNYSLNVTDTSNNTSNVVIQITQPLYITYISSNVSSNAYTNGYIDVTVAGGTEPYTYLWNNNETTQDINGLAAGTYSLVVTDYNGQNSNIEIIITEPSLSLQASFVVSNVTTYQGSNGAIYVTTTGGTEPYSFSWLSGQITSNLSNLSASNYSLEITDSTNSVFNLSIDVSEPLGGSYTYSNLSSYTANDGSINLSIGGGGGSYTYLWNDSNTSEDLSNLSAGTYSVTITDDDTNTLSFSNIVLTAPFGFSYVVSNVTVYTGSNGTIDITPGGGTAPYTYLWNDSNVSQNRSNLTAGTYSLTVSDFTDQSSNATIYVYEPLSISYETSNVSTYGNSNGYIDVTVAGGTGDYSYTWSSGSNTQDLSNLSAGTYTLTVNDTIYSDSISTTIIEPIHLSYTTSNVYPYGTSNGTINLTVDGGTPPYDYTWNTGAITQDVSNLSAGSYSVYVSDNTYLSYSTIQIYQPLYLSYTVTNASYEGSDGAIDLTVADGYGNYTYLWEDNSTLEDRSNLSAGSNYSVTVSDSIYTASLNSILVQESSPPGPIFIDYSVSNVTVYGGSNGSIDVVPTGGNSNYQYTWSTGSSNQDIDGLIAGVYVVEITDGVRTSSDSITVTQPIYLTYVKSNITMYGSSDGYINVMIDGGSAPYTYLWNTGSTVQDLSNVPAGTYTLNASDSTYSSNLTVQLLEPLNISVSKSNVSTYGQSNAYILLNINGGDSSNYAFSWNTGATSSNLYNLSAGTYSVTVSDGTYSSNVEETITQPIYATATPSNVSTYNGSNGTVDLSVYGGTEPYTYIWNNNATTQDLQNLTAGEYSVAITDGTYTASLNTTVYEPISISYVKTDATSYGGTEGNIIVLVSGGTGSYTYSWNGGQSTQDLYGLSNGTYFVTVTDGLYTDSLSITVDLAKTYNVDFTWPQTRNHVGVGIGTSVPLTALDVIGDINFTGDLYADSNALGLWTDSNGNSNIIYLDGNVGVNTSTPNYELDIIGQIRSTGYIVTSDGRLKTDISDETLGMNFINTLKPRTFKYVSDPEKTRHGFVAQDFIENGLNEFVNQDNDGYYTISLPFLISPMTKSLQELTVSTNNLKNRINYLKNQVPSSNL